MTAMSITIAAWPARWRLRRRKPARHSAPKRQRAALPAPRHATVRPQSPATRSGPAPAATEALLMAELAAPSTPAPAVEAEWADVTSVDLLPYDPPRYVRDREVQEHCEALRAARVMAGMLP